MSLNSQYLVLFKNHRDQQQIATLARQMYPEHSEKLLDAYQEATEVPLGSLVVNLKQFTPDSQRLRADIFSNDGSTNNTINDTQQEWDTEEDMDFDYESEDEKSAYDERIDAVWKEHNPLFQHKATELMEEDDIPEEEARSVAREQMLHRDKMLFMKKYNELLQSSVRLMGSHLHRAILLLLLLLIVV